MVVLDSSAAIEYLLHLRDGDWVADVLSADTDLQAPYALDAEVLHALRGLVIGKRVAAADAEEALAGLAVLDVARHPHVDLLPSAWALRNRFTGYDALFVTLAEALDVTLVTTDRPLARAARRHVDVLCP